MRSYAENLEFHLRFKNPYNSKLNRYKDTISKMQYTHCYSCLKMLSLKTVSRLRLYRYGKAEEQTRQSSNTSAGISRRQSLTFKLSIHLKRELHLTEYKAVGS